MLQAGVVGSHPVQTERELLQMVNLNPYQHALLCMHQAHYQPDAGKQAELLQVCQAHAFRCCHVAFEPGAADLVACRICPVQAELAEILNWLR